MYVNPDMQRNFSVITEYPIPLTLTQYCLIYLMINLFQRKNDC